MTLVDLVEEYMGNSQSERKDAIISLIASKLYTLESQLSDVVVALGAQLTDTQDDVRLQGMNLLTGVLVCLHKPILSHQEVEVVCSFLLERLGDHACIDPCVRGLAALVSHQKITGDMATRIAQSVFSEVRTQALVHSHRYQVLAMLSSLLDKHVEDLRMLGPDFVLGFIQAVDGEKDPRNLLLVFALVPVVTAHFDCSQFVEDLVEITSCYFPITFAPPPGDTVKITREDLSKGLHECLASTVEFGEYFMPILVEKMQSTLVETRREVFEALIICAPSYGHAWITPHLGSIWGGIRSEVVDNSDQPLGALSLKALRKVSWALADPIVGNSTSLDAFVKLVVGECEHTFTSVHDLLVQGKPSALLLTAMASAARSTCQPILSSIMPVLLRELKKTTNPNERHVLLETVVNLLRSAYDACGTGDVAKLQDHPAGPYVSDILAACQEALTQSDSPGLRTLGLYGMAALTALHLLDSNQLVEMAQHIAQVAALEKDRNVVQALADVGPSLCEHAPEAVITYVLLPLLVIVPTAGTHLDTILKIVSALAQPGKATPQAVEKLLAIVEASTLSPEGNVAVIGCISALVVRMAGRGVSEDISYLASQVGPTLLRLAGSGSLDLSELDNTVATTLRTICQAATPQEQTELLRLALDTAGLQEADTLTHLSMVPMAIAVLGSIHSEVVVPTHLLNKITGLALHGQGVDSCPSACLGLAAIVSKHFTGPHIQSLMETLRQATTGLQDNSKAAVLAWAWVTKALVMLGAPCQTAALDQLVAWLATPIGMHAAEGLGIVLADTEKVLTKACHCNIKALYKQRVFTTIIGRIKEGYSQNDLESRSHYLLALSHLLQHTSRVVLLAELPPLMPLLLESLRPGPNQLKEATLKTLQGLVGDAPSEIALHVDTLIPCLLTLSVADLSMYIRRGAVMLLAAMAALPYATLHPYKARVMAGIAVCLDDKKRIVRQQAVICSNKWALL